MELKRYVLLSKDFAAEARLFGLLGMRTVVQKPGWSAFGPTGNGEGPVELLSHPPIEGFQAAPGFEVEDLIAVHQQLPEVNLKVHEIAVRADGGYFFAQDPQGRFWHFYQKYRP